MVAEVTVTNIGRVPGKDVVQLYLEDVVCSVPRPRIELKGFAKVSLEPGESTRVAFCPHPQGSFLLR